MRIGSLFSGYGGLDLAVQSVLGGDVAWHVEFDASPAAILAQHFPEVPNHGDITKVNWLSVEPVDILTGGFPCQDVSLAGARRGIRADTRSGLWAHYARAIDKLRPSLVVIENVRGLLSADAHSDLEPCTWCVGDGGGESALRALGAVLGDLAGLGYDARWCGVSASDAGAPHGRFRIFIVAYPNDLGVDGYRIARRRRSESAHDARVASHASRIGSRESNPASERRAEVAHGAGLALERGVDDQRTQWGEFEPAVRRWEAILGRPAPAPRVEGRISARFEEWMMGLPDGWVTSVDLSWNAKIKALGNGVVPQQAELALRELIPEPTDSSMDGDHG